LKKLKILVIYNYFTPAYKAGGPIQSIINLVENLKHNYELYIIASNCDLGSNVGLPVQVNTWTDFRGDTVKVIYLDKSHLLSLNIYKLVQELNPDKILVNGIYSIPFSIIPSLFFSKNTIMHLRGMLHPRALNQKGLKKKVFIAFFKILGIHKRIEFCVSDELEKKYAQDVFGTHTKIWIAQNFPAKHDTLPYLKKDKGSLVMISLALISKMKNHLLVIEALNRVKSNIVWNIYGPIKDLKYWENCKVAISNLPSNIKVFYKGELNPNFKWDEFAQCHVSILPSESENFGHALYESMIAAKPIITSQNTPWKNLKENFAGMNAKLTLESITNCIETFANFDQDQYNQFCEGTRNYALAAIDIDKIKQQHYEMFALKNL